jgi:hypothetical protein
LYQPPADYSLIVKRVVLRGMTLAPLSKEGGLPRLLPFGMFAAVPRNLYLYDVRVLVTPDVFAEYLKFFRQQLRGARDTSAGPSLHTVSHSQPWNLASVAHVSTAIS